MLIENFYCSLKDEWWTPKEDLMETIRKKHLEILLSHRPDFYSQFNERQLKNNTNVLPVSQQLITPGIFAESSNNNSSSHSNAYRLLSDRNRFAILQIKLNQQGCFKI